MHKSFPFPPFRMQQRKEQTSECMHAWRMSLTKTVFQTLSLMLIDGLTLLCTIDIIGTNVVKFLDLSTLADKLRIVFETSKLKIVW